MTHSECNINLFLKNGYKTPKQADVYFNPKMRFNRELVLSTLKIFTESSNGTIECLDSFSATGICAMQWKKNLADKVAVYATDIRSECVENIKENCAKNDIIATELSISEIIFGQKCLGKTEGISVIKTCADVLMRMQGFDFIHLDPYGSTAPHLESALKNIRKDGILVLTSTDVASLLSRNPETVLRNYGAKVIKTQYKKELALRTIIAAAAQTAARCNKGIEVLLSVADTDFAFVALKILRGCKNADKSLLNVSDLLHCRVCEDRCWFRAGQLAPIVDPYTTLLSCDCHVKNSGKTGVKIGPFWSGSISDYDFVASIVNGSDFENHSDQFKKTLRSMKTEMEVFTIQQADGLSKIDVPSFYYLPNYLEVLVQVPRLDDIIGLLNEKGFLVSRVYMEPTAIRTNATMSQIKDIFTRFNKISL